MADVPDSVLRLRLRVTLKIMMALAAIAVAVVGVRYLGGADTASAPGRLRADLADLAPGQVRTLGWQGRPVIVLHRPRALVSALGERLAGDPSPGWFVAFANGTANGCTIVWAGEARRFRESCSEAAWDGAGRPAPGTDAGPLEIPVHTMTDDRQLMLGERTSSD